jgi:hypothetical protein
VDASIPRMDLSIGRKSVSIAAMDVSTTACRETSPPAQRVGRLQPRASEAEGRCPGERKPYPCGLKGRESLLALYGRARGSFADSLLGTP